MTKNGKLMNADQQLSAAQFARVLLLARIKGKSPPEIAEIEYDAREVFMAKGAVAGLGRADGLLSQTVAATQFADVVRAQTVIGRLNTVKVPFSTPLPYLVALTPFGFVGERMAIKASAPSFGSTLTLPRLKVAGLVVLPNELLSDSTAEEVLHRNMVSGLVAGTDLAFLDSTKAAVAFTRPASITHGAATFDATGASSLDDIDGVAAGLIAMLSAAGSNLAGAKFISSTQIATALAMMRGSGGQLAYPMITVNGGTLAGLPMLVSGSSPAGQLTIVDESEVMIAQDDGVKFEASTGAMIEQNSVPTGDTGTPTASSATINSMYQADSSALKVIQYVNWRMRNPFVAYASSFTPPAPSFGSP
jgi:HK97 family phage major capsid protein